MTGCLHCCGASPSAGAAWLRAAWSSSLRLPHRTLAGMVGARRPSVTTALGQLIARGEVERRPDGGWLLLGEPPEPREKPVTDHPSIAFERHTA